VVVKKGEKPEVVRGSGNVFRDLGHKNADAEQLKAILAAVIIKAVDREGLSVRAAHGRTGIAAADFSRIRNADLGRFTVDRLMAILNRLGARVEVKVRVRRAEAVEQGARAYEENGRREQLERDDADFVCRSVVRSRIFAGNP
jgi:predicted XRE-type DNA-binding protein